MAVNVTDFRPLRGMTISSQIVGRIRDALFAGELATGDVLGSEADLVKQFGVSRMSVRDALRSLEAMGIVEIRMGAKGGATIAAGSSDRFADALAIQLVLLGVTRDEILQARAALESMTAALAAAHASESDLASMRDLLDEARCHLDDPQRSAALGEKFHMAVARAAGNAVLIAQMKAMREVLCRPAEPLVRSRAKRMLEIHTELYKLIAAGDVERARSSMESHVRQWIS